MNLPRNPEVETAVLARRVADAEARSAIAEGYAATLAAELQRVYEALTPKQRTRLGVIEDRADA